MYWMCEMRTKSEQYFLWYMMFLPYYLPDSTLLRSPRIGFSALVLWILGQVSNTLVVLVQWKCRLIALQVAWLQQGFQLEFNGHSTFVPGLWASSIAFFLVNVGILGVIIYDSKSGTGWKVGVVKKRL